ncbi:Hypothetical protein MVR_LOCUS413 [uncultured virus]|nr:Hypothetical protein MVR_LOCUS413 [uncultured virus]
MQNDTLQYAKHITKQNIKTHKKLDFTTDQNAKLITTVEKVNTRIKKISDNQVLLTKNMRRQHMFLIVILNPNAAIELRLYKVIRCQRRYVADQLRKIKKKTGLYKILLKFASPNPITFWNKIMEDSINKKRFTCKANVIDIDDEYHINDLLLVIKKAHDDRLDSGEVLPMEVFDEGSDSDEFVDSDDASDVQSEDSEYEDGHNGKSEAS